VFQREYNRIRFETGFKSCFKANVIGDDLKQDLGLVPVAWDRDDKLCFIRCKRNTASWGLLAPENKRRNTNTPAQSVVSFLHFGLPGIK